MKIIRAPVFGLAPIFFTFTYLTIWRFADNAVDKCYIQRDKGAARIINNPVADHG